ncbi:MAG: ROK family transcriptional regulator [Micrococcales bacterium]|nr:ROK family transcriptional regulator [Micrococcales bacterium]
MRRGTNLPAVGGFNQAVVLDLIRRAPEGLSRVELADASGLSSQTVTNVCRRLLEGGLVREVGRVVAGPGKPRTILDIEPAGGYAIGVHLDPSFVTYVVVDLEGSVIADSRSRTPTEVRPKDVLVSMQRNIEGLVDSSGIERSRLLGVGIAAPGPIDREAGIVDDPPLLTGWHRVPLRDALAERLALPVALDKDVSAVAVAEAWSSGVTDAGVLYYGTGIGLGMIIAGEVLRGSTANAGDSGHLRVSDGGPLCRCGFRGCLGENSSPFTMTRAAARRGLLVAPASASDTIGVDEAYSRLIALAHDGVPEALEVVLRVADDVARGLVLVANLLDVPRMICAGPFWDRLASVGLERIRSAVAADPALVAPHPVRVDGTALGADVGAIGAACLVLDAVYSPRPAALLLRP